MGTWAVVRAKYDTTRKPWAFLSLSLARSLNLGELNTLTKHTRVQCLWKRREIDQIKATTTTNTMFVRKCYVLQIRGVTRLVVKLTFLVSFKYGLQI